MRCDVDVLEVQQLGVVDVEILDAPAGNESALLEQAVRGTIGLVRRDVQLRFCAASLDLGKQRRRNAPASVTRADDEQRNEALVEERVVQYREAQNFVTVACDDAVAVLQRRCNPLCPVRVRSQERVNETNARDVTRT